MSHLTALPDSSTSSSASVSLKTVFDFFARISKPAPVDGLYLFADLSARFTTFSAPIGCIYPSSALLYLRLRLFRPLRSHHIPKLGTDRLLSFSSTTTLIKIAPDLSDRMTYTPYDCRRLLNPSSCAPTVPVLRMQTGRFLCMLGRAFHGPVRLSSPGNREPRHCSLPS